MIRMKKGRFLHFEKIVEMAEHTSIHFVENFEIAV